MDTLLNMILEEITKWFVTRFMIVLIITLLIVVPTVVAICKYLF